MSNDLELIVGGRAFTGWEAVKVSRSLEAVAGAFSVEVSDRLPWPIRPGDAVTLRYGDDHLASGFVDQLRSSFDAKKHQIRIAGRDRTGDLVDGSALNDPGEWRAAYANEIIEQICDPFGIGVSLLDSPGPQFEVFKLQPGETAWTAIERVCRLRGLLAYTDRFDGSLVVANPGSLPAAGALVEGENLEAASVVFDHVGRYQTYIVRGQRAGTAEAWGETVAQVEGQARDGDVDRYRPLLVVAEGSVTPEVSKDRAEWEATVRRARSARLTAKVAGWRDKPGGRLWEVNRLVSVDSPTLQLSAELLISKVTHELGSSGTTTSLELVRAGSYLPKPDAASDPDPFAELLGESEE